MASLEWYSMAFEKASQVFVLLYEIVYLCATAMFYYLKLKIFWSIIGLVIILVMRFFGFEKCSPKNTGHNQAVFKYHIASIPSVLSHSLTKLLIFWRKAAYTKRDITLIGNNSLVLAFVLSSSIIMGWWKRSLGTSFTQSCVDCPKMTNAISPNPSVFVALSTSNEEGKIPSKYRGLVPMNDTIIQKVQSINWFRYLLSHFVRSFLMSIYEYIQLYHKWQGE